MHDTGLDALPETVTGEVTDTDSEPAAGGGLVVDTGSDDAVLDADPAGEAVVVDRAVWPWQAVRPRASTSAVAEGAAAVSSRRADVRIMVRSSLKVALVSNTTVGTDQQTVNIAKIH
jgi:hypothetical protein